MMRNVVAVPLGEKESLIISSDNSGAVGLKELDHVKVDYETVSYYSFRVAVMDCMAAGAEPVSIVLQNFCGDEQWNQLVSGVKKGLEELGLSRIEITGSTESNFPMKQSAFGIVVIGKKDRQSHQCFKYSHEIKLAVVGDPLVGQEVVEQAHEVVPLSLFEKLVSQKDLAVWPVGSKGIRRELIKMIGEKPFTNIQLARHVDLDKSAGPSTCFLVAYKFNREHAVKELAGKFFNPVLTLEFK